MSDLKDLFNFYKNDVGLTSTEALEKAERERERERAEKERERERAERERACE
jgi:hypothetical protein